MTQYRHLHGVDEYDDYFAFCQEGVFALSLETIALLLAGCNAVIELPAFEDRGFLNALEAVHWLPWVSKYPSEKLVTKLS